MPASFADRFTDALARLERDRDLDPLVSLFADRCEVGNVLVPDKFHGQEGARTFWTKYRDTFGEVKSTFHNRIEGDGRVALEWTTEGTTTGGKPFRYDGVSILEMEGEQIKRFHAYFDPHHLGAQVEDGSEAGQA